MPRNFTYVLNQLRMDTMAQCTSPTLSNSMTNPFAPRNKSKAISISCTREVIVSAGAIFTPTLLQVSGIGPSGVLKSLDILVKIDLPGVGCNLQDHPMVYANYYYRDESYFRSNEIADGVYDEAAEEYIRNRTGPWTAPSESVFDTTDHQTLMKHVMGKISTERHPSGTAAMMPLEMGGVVDPELKVYGTCSLRIADASIMPLIPSAHLQASAYGIAEKVRFQ
ncbi:Choline dehydrogenase [Fusarium oxysporum f. sp. cubense race 1]|uniref:Choline dehydrogenase n=1 Tax=Fusarium oxysporum f. sp. cubense (strain race 1) TaxID=1229664 RepID=N4UKP8_FUSC1|nr:Choline dehydrogenase [Fusarium oxysporum f. sp. cubense race 1]